MEKYCEFHTKSKVPAEGIVIRVLDNTDWESYKLKSFKFKLYLYFKKEIPDDEFLKNPIFVKRVLGFPSFNIF